MVFVPELQRFARYAGFLAMLFPVPALAQQDEACSQPLRDIVVARDFSLAYYCAAERLQGNPADTEALLVFARAAQELGQWDVALDYSKRARVTGLSGGNLFASYLISGMSEAGRGHMFAAKVNLRRGGDFASDKQERDIIDKALEQVAGLSPWSFGLHFSVDPNSNINGGSLHDSFHWLGLDIPLDGDAQAQAGIGYTLDGTLKHETSIGAHAIWENTVAAAGTAYDGRGRNDFRLSFKSGVKYSPPEGDPSLWYGYAQLEKRWIGAELGAPVFAQYLPYTTTATLALERHWQPGTGRLVSIYGNYSLQMSDQGGADSGIARLGAAYTFPLSDGVVNFGGYVEDIDSTDASVAAQSMSGNLGYTHSFAGPDIEVSAQVQLTHTEFKSLLFGYADIRMDDAVSLELAAAEKSWQFYGFYPRFGVEISRNFSNLERYDTQGLRVFTEIRSAF